jgi:hypothetical protein
VCVPTGPISETIFACCFCYTDYPDFILENTDEDHGADQRMDQWTTHINTIGYRENHNEGQQYCFCAEPRETPGNSTTINLTNGTTVAVVTGKFGHEDTTFQNEIDDLCCYIDATTFIHREKLHCVYQTPEFILHNKRFYRHLKYRLDPNDVSARGGGYWIHKPLLLRHYMDHYNDNDVIFWVDVDRHDFFWYRTYKTVLETMDRRKADFVIETLDFVEHRFTKEDVLRAFNATNKMRSSRQVNGNAIVVRNRAKMRHFMDAFIDCMADWHMVSDDESFLPNPPNFREHRHDQSILSMMVKTFLQNPLVIGPPAQPYQMGFSTYHTYQLFDHSNEDTVLQNSCTYNPELKLLSRSVSVAILSKTRSETNVIDTFRI